MSGGVGQTGFVYLAYPIDQTEGDRRERIKVAVHKIRDYINSKGWGTYSPLGAFHVGMGQAPSREIQAVNNTALGRCKGMVAFLPDGIPSIGTPIEIERAAANDIPVLILGGAQSWALARYQTYPNVRIVEPGVEIEWELRQLLGELDSMAKGDSTGTRDEILPFRQLRAPTDLITVDSGAVVRGELPARLPTRAYDGDAGYDLYASQTKLIETGQMVDIPTNLAVEMPDWAWGLLVGRSSTLRTKKLQVHSAVVDSGYRGELFAAVSKLESGGEPVVVEAGERVAQLVVMSNHSRLVRPVLVSELGSSARGVAGFGSSGR